MKKFLYGFIAILAAVSLASCAQESESNTETQTPEADTQTVTEESPEGEQLPGISVLDTEIQQARPLPETDGPAEDENVEQYALQTATEEPAQDTAQADAPAANPAYQALKAYVEENGVEDEYGKTVGISIDEITKFYFETDTEGNLTWTSYFKDEEAETVLAVLIDEFDNGQSTVQMLMKIEGKEHTDMWTGTLDKITLNYSDFSTIKLEIFDSTTDEYLFEDVLPTMIINTQITVLSADIAMGSLDLGISVADFGFPATAVEE